MNPLPNKIYLPPPPAYSSLPKLLPDLPQGVRPGLLERVISEVSFTEQEQPFFSADFYTAFHQKNKKEQIQSLGLTLLGSMRPSQVAELPLFKGACIAYQELVMNAKKAVLKLAQPDIDMEAAKEEFESDNENITAALKDDSNKLFENTFSDPDLYHPIDAEKWLFSDRFYDTFNDKNGNELAQNIGLIVLRLMNIEEQAGLPIFDDACQAYRDIVRNAIRIILVSKETDDETLSTKRRIMACFSSHAWRWSDTIYGGIAINLDQVNLMGLNVSKFDFTNASLQGTNFSFVDMRGISLEGAKTTGAIFTGARLDGTNLRQMNLPELILVGVNLERAYIIGVDFRGINLAAANLRFTGFCQTQLAEANLHGANLEGANLFNMDLSGVNFSKASLRRAKLYGANLTNVNWYQADFRNADLSNVSLRSQKLSGVNLAGAKLERVVFCDVSLDNVNMSDADLSYAQIKNCDFKKVNLSGANLLCTELFRLDLSGVDLCRAKFVSASLSGVSFTGANLSGVSFIKINLGHLNLSGVNLQGARFVETRLHFVNLRGAILVGVDFSSMNLRGVDFSGARMRGAQFRGTNLTHTIFSNVDLSSLDLSDTDLTYATLTNTNLTDTNLTFAKFFSAKFVRTIFHRTMMTSLLTDNRALNAYIQKGGGRRIALTGERIFDAVPVIPVLENVDRAEISGLRTILSVPVPVIDNNLRESLIRLNPPQPRFNLFNVIYSGIRDFFSWLVSIIWSRN